MPRKSKKKKGKVLHTVGGYGSRVRVVDRGAGRSLRLEFRYRGKRRRQSLAHRDVDAAKELANQLANKLSEGEAVVPTHKPTAASVIAEYLQAAANKPATKRKARSSQYHERRCARAWIRFLGPDKNLHNLTLGEWEKFWRLRAEGAVDANGDDVPEDERRPVRPRTVAADLKWLKYVIRWATRWKTASGAFLMREDPTKGWEVPSDPNPRQPVATWDRFEKIRAVADQVTMPVVQDEKPLKTLTYLPELLDLAAATGRRRGAILRLRYSDLRLDAPRPMDLPKGVPWFGEIEWPGSTDKKGKAWTTPINELARAALDRVLEQRPAFNPDGYLFPSPRKPVEPIRGDVASRWLRQAEKLAGVEPMDGSLWHAYRRMWATERKDLPVQDVAQAGGWKDLKTLQTSYMQADTATTYAVVTHRTRSAQDQKAETR